MLFFHEMHPHFYATVQGKADRFPYFYTRVVNMCKIARLKFRYPSKSLYMRSSFLFRFKLHYLLALGAFVTWMLFFDEKDYFTQLKRKQELEKLEGKIGYYKEQIAITRKQVEALDRDPAMLEKFAREKYFMKRDNEDVYIVEMSNSEKSNPK